jgi:hypothetical protein
MAATQREHDPEDCERQRAALDELARLGEDLGDVPLVCIAHMRFEPCRKAGAGCRLSSDPEDVLRVTSYQQEEAAE